MKKMWKGGVLFVLCVLCLYTANEAKATSKTSDEAINWVKSQVGNAEEYPRFSRSEQGKTFLYMGRRAGSDERSVRSFSLTEKSE